MPHLIIHGNIKPQVVDELNQMIKQGQFDFETRKKRYLMSNVNGSKVILPYMIAEKTGPIINMSPCIAETDLANGGFKGGYFITDKIDASGLYVL